MSTRNAIKIRKRFSVQFNSMKFILNIHTRTHTPTHTQSNLSEGTKICKNSVGIAMESFSPNEFKLMAMLMLWLLQSALNIHLMYVIKAYCTLYAERMGSVLSK